ncbi:MAG: glycosyltransferase family 39 protein [Actinomycetota bacterium]
MTASTATVSHERPTTLLRRLIHSDVALWERLSFLGLLIATAFINLVNLTSSGWANSFYSAAVQAGASNWEAFFYGSSDAANSITVDKPPASLWIMDLSVRLFGLSSFSILLPEAIMGVVTVALVYVMVRRHFSAGTALLAGGVLALTPVAVLMFRFNNPDALLVLLMTLAAYFTLRGIESGKMRWILWAGAMVGLGFLTKQLQAFLIVPVLVAAYLWMSKLGLGKRLLRLVAALGVLIVSAGWWVAIVELVPASMRPFVGGSQTDSFLELTFGYNGLGRLTGSETGSVGGGAATAGATGNWGATGILRLFQNEIGGQISWLLPAALIVMVAGFVLLFRTPRTDPRRVVLFLFSGWLLVTALFFSFMAGIFHAYYTVALAPPLAGTLAIGASLLWSRRAELWARIILSATVFVTAFWAYSLLAEASSWLPWLKYVVLVLGFAGGLMLLLPRRGRMLAAATMTVALVSALIAPAAYSLETVSTGHIGSIVTAGPTVSGSGGLPGGGGGFGAPGGGPGAQAQNQAPPALRARGTGGGIGGGGKSGLLGGGTVSTQVVTTLSANASSYTWVAAAIGSNNASVYQLESGHSVMPIGGFNGTDPSPTLAQFKSYVAAGEIHYFIDSGSLGQAGSGSSDSSAIAGWIEKNFTATTVDGVTLYDLTK